MERRKTLAESGELSAIADRIVMVDEMVAERGMSGRQEICIRKMRREEG